jgi:hypothetical protein
MRKNFRQIVAGVDLNSITPDWSAFPGGSGGSSRKCGRAWKPQSTKMDGQLRIEARLVGTREVVALGGRSERACPLHMYRILRSSHALPDSDGRRLVSNRICGRTNSYWKIHLESRSGPIRGRWVSGRTFPYSNFRVNQQARPDTDRCKTSHSIGVGETRGGWMMMQVMELLECKVGMVSKVIQR